MTEELIYYLGIDWGKTLCGLAIADNETRIANTYGEIETTKFFERLEEVAKGVELKVIVVGKIQLKDGQYKNNSKKIEEFIEKIEEKGFIVEEEEELFSTKMAQANLADVRKKGISKNDNAESARIILQAWLDRKS